MLYEVITKEAKDDIKNIAVTMEMLDKKVKIKAEYTKKPFNRPNSGASAIILVPKGIDRNNFV